MIFTRSTVNNDFMPYILNFPYSNMVEDKIIEKQILFNNSQQHFTYLGIYTYKILSKDKT